MSQSVAVNGPKTFKAGEDLEAFRRVKVESGTTTTPPEVVYADAGEAFIGITREAVDDGDYVSVDLFAKEGTFFAEAADSFSVQATLYGAADGKVSDSSNGTGFLIALEAATAAGDIVEVAVMPFAATTAASISIADSGGFTSQATVEAALAEIYQHIASAQAAIHVPLGALTLEDGTAITTFSDGASATPGFSQESNKEVVLRWNNHATPTAVAFSVVLPEDLDDSADVIIHWLAKMSGATDSPEITHECYIGAGDTDCAGTDDEIDGGTTLTEYTATIAAANVSAAPQPLTVIFQPKDGELGTDDCLIYGVWVEYTRQILTA